MLSINYGSRYTVHRRASLKTLKSFKERDTETRWGWLQSRAVIVLHDLQGIPVKPSSGLPLRLDKPCLAKFLACGSRCI
jgi:hypothetical protein